ncbi:hypothetical protein B0O99DRAFT_600444 [Bisporella sp. PMI_857]|nr:hypothetical protein B0O99DRAFT_600444 [Bisporella sp. PMI_857]
MKRSPVKSSPTPIPHSPHPATKPHKPLREARARRTIYGSQPAKLKPSGQLRYKDTFVRRTAAQTRRMREIYESGVTNPKKAERVRLGEEIGLNEYEIYSDFQEYRRADRIPTASRFKRPGTLKTLRTQAGDLYGDIVELEERICQIEEAMQGNDDEDDLPLVMVLEIEKLTEALREAEEKLTTVQDAHRAAMEVQGLKAKGSKKVHFSYACLAESCGCFTLDWTRY